MTTEARLYTCAECLETFESTWTQAESEAEAEQMFTAEERARGMATVCEECFANLLQRHGKARPA